MEYEIPKMTVQQHQIALHHKLKTGYNLCIANPTMTCNPIYFFSLPREEQEKFLIYDTKTESYRMLVTNYSIALVGYKKNDKYSLYFYPPEGKEQEVKDFIEQNKNVIEKLYKARNKVYAHFDVDYEEQTEKIEYSEIKKIVDFVGSVLPVVNDW